MMEDGSTHEMSGAPHAAPRAMEEEEKDDSLPMRPSDLKLVSQEDIKDLLMYFSKNVYRAGKADEVTEEAMRKCMSLFRNDYTLRTIENTAGELCGHYPSHLVVLDHEDDPEDKTIYEEVPQDEVKRLRNMILRARKARCRARFPIPVIVYNGKYVCRSATIASGAEMFSRSSYDYICSSADYFAMLASGQPAMEVDADSEDEGVVRGPLHDVLRNADIELLKAFNVGTIVDFMVENKKVKYGFNVTSSEKVDKENRYADFSIISLPYPGCEFFKEYHDSNYAAEGLVFDWSQEYIDADIKLPAEVSPRVLNINWDEYKSWDLVTITQNYLKMLLRQLREGTSSILIHCISGWDRTPLFVSLLRLLLWADGHIHRHLDAHQILYLTIAYDWMLFGHHLPDRLEKKEDIFFFCFNVLKHLTDEEYSLSYTGPARARSRDKERTSVYRSDSETCIDTVGANSETASSEPASPPPAAAPHTPVGSLSSMCSSVIVNKSPDQQLLNASLLEDAVSNNGNCPSPDRSSKSPPSATKRTSPVSVPGSGRQRHDSSSSMSMGSWHMISGTGSIRDSLTPEPPCINANSMTSTLVNSNNTLIDDEHFSCGHNDNDSSCNTRKARLSIVRETFLKCYHGVIEHNFSEDSALGQIMNTLYGLGIMQRPAM